MKPLTHAVPVLLALTAACQEQSAVPTAGRPLFATAAANTCPAHARARCCRPSPRRSLTTRSP